MSGLLQVVRWPRWSGVSVLGFAMGRDGERGTGIRWLIGQMAWQSGTETGKETLGGAGGNDEVSYKFSES